MMWRTLFCLYNKINYFYLIIKGKSSSKVLSTTNLSLAVKGKNNLSKRDLIIIGSLCNESEQVLLRESCSDYFNKFKKNKFRKLVKEKSNSKQSIRDTIRECRNEVNVSHMKDSNSLITKILLETSISQSIGRNQGFRSQENKTAKTVVVLPLLHSMHVHRIERHLNLSYTSSLVVKVS